MAKRGKSFEQLVAAIQDTVKNCPHTIVQTNVKIKDTNDVYREIDVLVIDRSSFPSKQIAFECKEYAEPVGITLIDEIIGKFVDLPTIDKKIMVTSTGYTLGAKKKATNNGIDLFLIKDVPLDAILLTGKPCLGNLKITITDINFDLYPSSQYSKSILNIDETNEDKQTLYQIFHYYFDKMGNEEYERLALIYCKNKSQPFDRMYHIEIEEPTSFIKDTQGNSYAISTVRFTVKIDFVITAGDLKKMQIMPQADGDVIAAKYRITDDFSMLRVKTSEKEEYYLEDANLTLHKPYKSKL